MKSKMKSAFAIIAVALMIMVAIVPMAGMLVSDTDTSADDTGNVTVVVKQNNGAVLAGVKVTTTLSNDVTGADGKVTIPIASAAGLLLKPEKFGFKFTPESVQLNGSEVKAGDTYTFTAFTNQSIVSLTAGGKAVSAATVQVITKTAYDALDAAATAFGTATTYTADAEGKVYISMVEPTMYLRVTIASPATGFNGDLTFSGETGAKANAYTVAGAKTVVADQTLYTVNVADKSNTKITEGISVSIKDDTSTTVPVTATTADGKALILFKKAATATKVIATATNYTISPNYTFAVDTGIATKDVSGNAVTFNALESQYTIKVADKDNKIGMDGSVTVQYTLNGDATDYSRTATVSPIDPITKKFTFTVLDNQLKNIKVVLGVGSFKDCLDNVFTFPGNEATPAENTYVFTNTGVKDITINAKEGTISISGNVFYKDGATKYEGTGKLTLGTQDIDNTVDKGSYSFYVMKVTASSNIVFDLSGTGFTSLNTMITLPAGLERSITGMDFTLNQSKKVSVSIAVSNGGAIDKVSGLTVKAGDVALTWNSTTETYDGQLERASCTVTVGPKIGSATSDIASSTTIVNGVITYNLTTAGAYAVNEDKVTITLSKINVNGYISYKSDDGKYRPIMDESTSLKYTVGAAAEAILTTKLNGEYGSIEVPYGEVVKFKYAPTAGTKYYESSVKVDSLTGAQVANIKLDAFEYKTVATGNIFGNKAFATNAKAYYIAKISVSVNSGTATQLDVDENGLFNFNTLEVKAGDSLTISTPEFRFGLTGSAYHGETITVPASMKIEVNTNEYIYEGKITAANGCALEGVTTTYTDVTNGDAALSAKYITTSSDKDGKFYFIITPATSKETKLFKVTSTATGSTAYEYSPYYRVQTVISTAEKIGEWSISTGLLTNTIDATTYDPRWDGDLRSIDYYISGTVTDAFSKPVDTGVLQYEIGATPTNLNVNTDGKFVIGRVASDATLTFPDNASYGKVTGGDNWKTTPSLKLVTEKGKLTVTVNEAKKSYSASSPAGVLKTITPVTVKIDDVVSSGTHYAKMNSKVKVTLGTDYYGEVIEGTVPSNSIILTSTYVTFTFGVFAVDSPSREDTGSIKVDGAPATAGASVTKILKADAEHKVTCDWTSDGRYIIDGNGTLSNTDEKLITIQKVDISRHVFKVTYKDASGRYGIPGADMNVYAKAEVTSSNYVGTFVTDENGEFFIDADKYAKVTVGADKGIWLFTPFGDLYSIEYGKKADLASWPINYAIDVKAAEVRAEFDFTGYYDHKAVSGLEVTFKYDGGEILKTTDSEGKIYLDAVKVGTEFTISSPAHVFVSTDAELKTDVEYTVTATAYGAEYLAGKYAIGGNIAYDGGKDGRVIASNDSFVVGDEKITTDKDGKFTLAKVSTTYVFSKIGFTNVSVSNYALINVDGVITYDLGTVVFEYKPVEGQLFVKNKVAFTGAGLNDLAVIKNAKSDAKGVGTTGAVDISFVTDDEGMYSFDVPNAVTTVEGITDNGYPFSIDVATGDVTVSADRVLVNVSDSATKDLKDVVVLGSRSESKFFEYRAVTDKDGTAIFDSVDAANFYAYIPGFTVSYAFGSDGSTIAAGANGTYKVAGYAMQFGGEPVANVTTYKIFLNGVQVSTAIEGDAVVISMENGDAGATLKVITTSDGTYVSSLNSTSFKYWELSDGTTSDKAQIAFVAGSDSMKTVGDSNAYAFTAVFDESCDKVISSDSSSEQKINPTVLVIGIAAVIVALIAVVYTVIQKKE